MKIIWHVNVNYLSFLHGTSINLHLTRQAVKNNFLSFFATVLALSFFSISCQKTDEIKKNKETAARYHELNPDDIDAVLSNKFIGRSEENNFSWNREDHRKFLTDGRYKKDSIYQQIAEGDWVVTRFFRTLAWDGDTLKTEAMEFKRFENGRISEIREYGDSKTIYPMKKEANANMKKGARIKPLPMSEMRSEWIKTLERLPGAGLKGLYTPVNVFGTLMYNPGTCGPFLDYWVTSKLEMGLSVREQELIILRMGFHYNCNYVWKHHVPVAKEFGVSDAQLAAVKTSPLPAAFSDHEYTLLMLTDELVEYRTIREEAWIQWGVKLDKPLLLDLISIVSQYVFFALLNNGIQVEIEEPLTTIPGL